MFGLSAIATACKIDISEIVFRCNGGDLIAKTGAGKHQLYSLPNLLLGSIKDRVMDLKQLYEMGGDVHVTVRLEDLRQWHRELTAAVPSPLVSPVLPQTGELYTRKQTIALLGVDSSTLWRWAKSGYLVPVEYGGQRRYRVADVQQILKGGRHDC